MSCQGTNQPNLLCFTVGGSVPVWWETSSQLPAISSLIAAKLGCKGCPWNHILLVQRVFPAQSCSLMRAWWRTRTSSFEMSPSTHLPPLLILAYALVTHVRRWSGSTLKMPTETDLRKQKTTHSCKWPQQTLELDGWVEMWKYEQSNTCEFC